MGAKVSLHVYRDSEIDGCEEKVTLLLVDYPIDLPEREIAEIQLAVSGPLVEAPGYIDRPAEESYSSKGFQNPPPLPPGKLHSFSYAYAINREALTRATVTRADYGHICVDTADGEKDAKIVAVLPNSLDEVREGLLYRLEASISRNISGI